MFQHILLATGARPKTLPSLAPDGKQIITYFEAMNLPAQPRSLCIVGAGAIGVAHGLDHVGDQRRQRRAADLVRA